MKKIIATVLCITVSIIVFAGCSNKDENTDIGADIGATEYPYGDAETPPEDVGAPSEEPSPEDTEDSANQGSIDFDAAFTAFTPDTVMIKAGEYTVTWAEFFFFLHGNINTLLSSLGEIPNWSDVLYADMTYADFVLNYSVDSALMYKAIEYGAKLSGVTLSAEDFDYLRGEYEYSVELYGNEEEFLKLIWEQDGCCSKELLDYLVSTGYLASLIFGELYGESGEKLSDEEAAELTADDGFLMAWHILRMKPEEGEDTARAEIEDILKQLNDYSGDDFDSFFNELMYEHTEDQDGLSAYPYGYLFQDGDMVESFYEACSELPIGEYSGIVESDYGYHIVYRIPINYDVVPFMLSKQGDYRSLRSYVAYNLFDLELLKWQGSLEPEFSPEYESIDMAVIFNLGQN